jgi:hypothetical protein
MLCLCGFKSVLLHQQKGMMLPTFKIVKYVLGLMILDIPNRRDIPYTMNLVELHKVAELYGENFSLQIFTQKDH